MADGTTVIPAAPAETPPAAPTPSGDTYHLDRPDTANYEELADIDLDVETPVEPAPKVGQGEPKPPSEPKPSEPPKPVVETKPVAEPPKVETPPATPPAAPAVPPAQPQPAATATPQQPGTEQPRTPTPEDIKREREATVSQLTEMYKFSDAEAAELVTNPEKIIPRVAANLHLGVFESILQVVGQQLPLFVRNALESERRRTDNWTAFTKEWPELDKPEYYPEIVKAMQLYRGLNPQAKLGDYVKDVGAMLAMRLGIVRNAAPVAPPPPAPKPHMPANPGASASGGAARASDNPFEVIAREFENLDRD